MTVSVGGTRPASAAEDSPIRVRISVTSTAPSRSPRMCTRPEVGNICADGDLQQRGLAGAVRAEDHPAFVDVDIPVHRVEQHRRAASHRDLHQVQDRIGPGQDRRDVRAAAQASGCWGTGGHAGHCCARRSGDRVGRARTSPVRSSPRLRHRSWTRRIGENHSMPRRGPTSDALLDGGSRRRPGHHHRRRIRPPAGPADNVATTPASRKKKRKHKSQRPTGRGRSAGRTQGRLVAVPGTAVPVGRHPLPGRHQLRGGRRRRARRLRRPAVPGRRERHRAAPSDDPDGRAHLRDLAHLRARTSDPARSTGSASRPGTRRRSCSIRTRGRSPRPPTT